MLKANGWEKVVERFLGSPAGLEVVEAERAASQDIRKALKHRLDELDREDCSRAKAMGEIRGRLLKQAQSAKALLDEAQSGLANIQAREIGESWRSSMERSDLERALEDGAAEEIDLFLSDLRSAVSHAQSGAMSIFLGTRSDLFGRVSELYSSNGPTTAAFIEAAIAIRTEANLLRLEVDQSLAIQKLSELKARLAECYAGIELQHIESGPPIFVRENSR